MNIENLSQQALKGEQLSEQDCLNILENPEIELLPLINEAYKVRKTYHGKKVAIHIINNAKNGNCPEDCNYCAQAKTSEAQIEDYPMKSDAEILEEAKRAYEAGAKRYCMVFAGRGPSKGRVEHLARLIREIKQNYPIGICVSPGLLDEQGARTLKDAGLDRLNHNLNTSESMYSKICSTHTYSDRLNTLESARKVGLEVCSGMITGMGEQSQDIIEVALKLRELKAPSIPVNFLVPIEGNKLDTPQNLSPEKCLRILCLFRFLNPKAEIRAAAGREGHLRQMEVLCFYVANSIFLEGYLNTKGSTASRTLQLIKDAGFEIESEHKLDEILHEQQAANPQFAVDGSSTILKSLEDLKPTTSSHGIETPSRSTELSSQVLRSSRRMTTGSRSSVDPVVKPRDDVLS